MKTCTKCSKRAPLEDFPPLVRSRDGREGACRECKNARHAAWLVANKERRVGHVVRLCLNCKQEFHAPRWQVRGCCTRKCAATYTWKTNRAKEMHGHSLTGGAPSLTYMSWQRMLARCEYTKNPSYHRYGARGITVCERWHSFVNFLADMGERPAGMQLDRIDNDGNYEPGNCRWVSPKENSRHRSSNVMLTFNGVTQCLSAWAEETGVPQWVISTRRLKGWPTERLLTEPVKRYARRQA